MSFGTTERRLWLIAGLEKALRILKRHGCRDVFLDGSFASSKPAPNDYDACWSTDGVKLDDLKNAAPAFFDFTMGRAAQKALFRGEFFPSDLEETRSGQRFLAFFQVSRETGDPKGILHLSLPVSPL